MARATSPLRQSWHGRPPMPARSAQRGLAGELPAEDLGQLDVVVLVLPHAQVTSRARVHQQLALLERERDRDQRALTPGARRDWHRPMIGQPRAPLERSVRADPSVLGSTEVPAERPWMAAPRRLRRPRSVAVAPARAPATTSGGAGCAGASQRSRVNT